MISEIATHLLVFVAGVLAGGYFVMYKWEQVFEGIHLVSALGQMDVARQIREGTSAQLLASIDDALPIYFEGIDSNFRRTERVRVALAALQAYFVVYSIPLTPGTQRILDTL